MAVILSGKVLSSQAGELRWSRNLDLSACCIVIQMTLSKGILHRPLRWRRRAFGSPLVLSIIVVILAAR